MRNKRIVWVPDVLGTKMVTVKIDGIEHTHEATVYQGAGYIFDPLKHVSVRHRRSAGNASTHY